MKQDGISGENGGGVALVRLDAKCHVLIPKTVRDRAGISAGSVLFVVGFEDVLLLRKAGLDALPIRGVARRLRA